MPKLGKKHQKKNLWVDAEKVYCEASHRVDLQLNYENT